MVTEELPQRVLTGRAVKVRKTCVDEVESFDMADMRRDGVLGSKLGALWISRPRVRGRVADSEIGYAMLSREIDSARVGIFSTWPPKDDFQLDYVVRLVTTECNFGGVRFWFECPGEGLNKSCLGRVRILYRAESWQQLRCRGCNQLTYESRQGHRSVWLELIAPLLNCLRKVSHQSWRPLTPAELEESTAELKTILNRRETFKKFLGESS